MNPLTARLIAGAALVLLILAVVIGGPAACSKINSMRAQHRLDTAQGEALSNSAADAVNTQGSANARERSSDDLTAANRKDILNAQGADAAVNPAVRDAGLASLCGRKSYSNSERCKLLRAPAK